MTDAARPGHLDATVAPSSASEILADLGAYRRVLSKPDPAHRFCTHEAAAARLADLAKAGELTSCQHETAVSLLPQWTGTVRALVEASRALRP